MSLNDIDLYYIKSVSALHSYEFLNGEPCGLQLYLEEAIKNKSGNMKDLSGIISSVIKQNRLEELKSHINVIEESKTTSSSDNELEDLMDLMCVVCNEMDVGAGNRLLECNDCHSLYHQECHRPPVTSSELDGTWICQGCREATKKMKKSPISISPSRAASPPLASSSKHSPLKPTVPQIPSSTPLLSPYKSSSSKSSPPAAWTKSGSTKLPSSGKSPSTIPSGNSNVKSTVTPNINIISADKRIQIMKKKAAKLQEKRKLPR